MSRQIPHFDWLPRNHHRSSCFIALSFLILSVAVPLAPALGQQSSPLPEMDALATRVAQALAKKKINSVAVMSFEEEAGRISSLGRHLADQLAIALAKAAPRVKVIGPARVEAFCEQEKLSPAEMHQDQIARWVGEEVGAKVVAMGSVKPGSDAVELSVEVLDVHSGKPLALENRKLQSTADLEPYLQRDLENLRSGTPTPPDGVYAAGKHGVTVPECIRCPSPSFPPELISEAPRGYFHASVRVIAVVGTDGTVTEARVLRGAPFGLSDQALRAVRTWRMKPATKDGIPVPARVVIDVTYTKW